jgi:sugar O-acyltransferase (sialic acid O-acetyltransferase NeuD family)
MKDLIIIGAGDFSKEIRWVIERINAAHPTWRIKGYVDDAIPADTLKDGLPVLGPVVSLLGCTKDTDLVFAIANCRAKKWIAEMLKSSAQLNYPVILDPESVVSDKAILEQGVVICAGVVVMPYAIVREMTHVNWNSTVGHDSVIGSYTTVYPGCNISGKVEIGDSCEIGTGSKIIQGIQIPGDVVLGAGTVVVKSLMHGGTYVGVPARIME